MKSLRAERILHGAPAGVAIGFGVVTIVAGSRVLAGADPGYVVFRPLLLYNTGMGVAYVGAGLLAWRNLAGGKYAAAAIFLLNLLVLGMITYLHVQGGPVAVESVRAMVFRTVVWLGLFGGLARLSHK